MGSAAVRRGASPARRSGKCAKIGDHVEIGQALFTLFSEDEALLEEPYRMLEATVQIGDQRPVRLSLVRQVVKGE
jgi:thymidine phosphorylase